ncbi:hypothetical protein ACX9I7_29855 [Streptomyces sp. L500]
MKRGDQRNLHEVAAAQGGVLLTTQAVECGLRPSGAAGALRRAGWSRLYCGTWGQPGLRIDTRLRLLAVQLRHPEWVGSHGSAAALYGIPALPHGRTVRRGRFVRVVGDDVVELTDPRRRGQTRVPGVVVHAIRLAARETTVVAGVRVTTALRTICDLLMALPAHEAVIAADFVLAQGLADREQIREALGPDRPPDGRLDECLGGRIDGRADVRPGRHLDGRCGRRRRNVRSAREALALADPASGSPAESMARLWMHGVGLRPESQAEVTTPNGRLLRLDFLFRAEGLGVEIEGYTWHGSRSAHQNDIRRFNELSGCEGIRQVLRFSGDDVFRRPRLMIHTIQEALSRLRESAGSSIVVADVHPNIPSHEGALPCPSSTGSRPPTTRR